MRLVAWFVSLSLVFLLVWVIWGGHWAQWTDVNAVAAALGSHGISVGWAGAILLVLDLLLPVPGTIVMSALGFVYGTIGGGLISLAGSLAAGMIGYGVGRLCSEKNAIRFLGEKDYQKGKLLFQRGGGWVVGVSRAVPILPEAISVTAGLLRMPVGAFFLSLLCGSAPMSFVFAWIGATGHDRPWLTFSLSFAIPAVLWSAASYWQKKDRIATM